MDKKVWMDGWKKGWMVRWIKGWIDERMNGWIGEWRNELSLLEPEGVDEWVDG